MQSLYSLIGFMGFSGNFWQRQAYKMKAFNRRSEPFKCALTWCCLTVSLTLNETQRWHKNLHQLSKPLPLSVRHTTRFVRLNIFYFHICKAPKHQPTILMLTKQHIQGRKRSRRNLSQSEAFLSR